MSGHIGARGSASPALESVIARCHDALKFVPYKVSATAARATPRRPIERQRHGRRRRPGHEVDGLTAKREIPRMKPNNRTNNPRLELASAVSERRFEGRDLSRARSSVGTGRDDAMGGRIGGRRSSARRVCTQFCWTGRLTGGDSNVKHLYGAGCRAVSSGPSSRVCFRSPSLLERAAASGTLTSR